MIADLYSLAYFSRSAVGEDGAAAEIERLLATARARNAAHGITGALLYSDRCFAQVLEGPLAAVEAIFEKIEVDPRHRDVALLHFKPVDARSFADWSMAFAGVHARTPLPFAIPGVVAQPDAAKRAGAGERLVAVLRDLIAKHDACSD